MSASKLLSVSVVPFEAVISKCNFILNRSAFFKEFIRSTLNAILGKSSSHYLYDLIITKIMGKNMAVLRLLLLDSVFLYSYLEPFRDLSSKNLLDL